MTALVSSLVRSDALQAATFSTVDSARTCAAEAGLFELISLHDVKNK